jgi:preprotein translocase subunit SecE
MQDFEFTAPDFGSNPKEYLKEVKAELKKVEWPTRQQVKRATILVFAVSAVVGGLLGGLDFIFTKLFATLLQK